MSRRAALALGFLLVWALAAAAAPPTEEQLLNKSTFAFVRVETGQLWKRFADQGLRQWMEEQEQNLTERMREGFGFGPEAVERLLVLMVVDEEGRPPHTATFLTLNGPCDRTKVKNALLRSTRFRAPDPCAGAPPTVPAAAKQIEETVGGYSYWTFENAGKYDMVVCFLDDQHLLLGEAEAVRTVLEGLGASSANGPMAEYLRRARSSAFAFAANLDLIPAKEKANVPMPFNTLVKAKSAFLTATLTEQLDVKAEGNFGTEAEAKAAATALSAALGLAKGSMPMLRKELAQAVVEEPDMPMELYEFWPQLEAALGEIKPLADGTQVKLTATLKAPPVKLMLLPLLAVSMVGMEAQTTFRSVGGVIGEAKEPPRLPRPESAEALKKLAAGLEKYRAEHGRYPPPAILSSEGKPLLSWRVALLPYVGEEELYRQFKLNEPWNSAHNRPLLEKLPGAYKTTFSYGGRTPFRILCGEKAPFTERTKTGPSMAEFTDGAGNTALVVEAHRDVPWTRPENLKLLPDFPLPRMEQDAWDTVGGGGPVPGFYVLMGDGAVRFFEKKKLDTATRRALLTRSGGETLAPEKLGEVIK